MAELKKAMCQLRMAFDNSDGAEFKRLVQNNPSLIDVVNGEENYLWIAAMMKNLPIVKALVELGADINRSNDLSGGDESHPFYEPEGIVLQSIRSRDAESISWLLENGAKLNFEIQGEVRCLPLIAAAVAGDLEIVKMLVKHGAVLDSKFHGADAIRHADENGKVEVRDYLVSLRNSGK